MITFFLEFYDYNGVPVEGSTDPGPGVSTSCSPTLTKHFGVNAEEQNICGGQLIFEETFDNQNAVNNLKWTTVEKFPGNPVSCKKDSFLTNSN